MDQRFKCNKWYWSRRARFLSHGVQRMNLTDKGECESDKSFIEQGCRKSLQEWEGSQPGYQWGLFISGLLLGLYQETCRWLGQWPGSRHDTYTLYESFSFCDIYDL